MKNNPADQIKDQMWGFLMDKGQKANISALKGYVYDLIQMTTQKTGGHENHTKKGYICNKECEMTMFSIVIEATALVLSGKLDELEKQEVQQETMLIARSAIRSNAECI